MFSCFLDNLADCGRQFLSWLSEDEGSTMQTMMDWLSGQIIPILTMLNECCSGAAVRMGYMLADNSHSAPSDHFETYCLLLLATGSWISCHKEWRFLWRMTIFLCGIWNEDSLALHSCLSGANLKYDNLDMRVVAISWICELAQCLAMTVSCIMDESRNWPSTLQQHCDGWGR